MVHIVTGGQIRMARGFLKLSASQLASQAGVGISTVKRIEEFEGVPNASAANLAKVQSALEAQGVRFLSAGDTVAGHGVEISPSDGAGDPPEQEG